MGKRGISKVHRFNAFSRNSKTIEKLKNFSHRWWNIQVKENSTSILERDTTLRSLKKYERMYHWGWSWRARLVNNTVYQFVFSNLGAEIFSKKIEHRCVEIEEWGFSVHFYWGLKKIQFTLYTYVSAKILQNGAKFIQKLTPGFKTHMRNFDNFRQSRESPKSWNMMGYFCLKDTFLQLKHYLKFNGLL